MKTNTRIDSCSVSGITRHWNVCCWHRCHRLSMQVKFPYAKNTQVLDVEQGHESAIFVAPLPTTISPLSVKGSMEHPAVPNQAGLQLSSKLQDVVWSVMSHSKLIRRAEGTAKVGYVKWIWRCEENLGSYSHLIYHFTLSADWSRNLRQLDIWSG